MGLARSERAALADYLAEVGPDRPTLCAGWLSADLLVHLLIRERRPDGAPVLPGRALGGHARRVREQIRARPWSAQVDLFRTGPPAWNPLRLGRLDEVANGAELFLHHEDVRRGVPPWEPRTLDPATAGAVADQVASRFNRFRFRRSPVGITAVLPGRDAVVLHTGTPAVEVHGQPAEVLLWLAGRAAVQVSLQGPADAVRAAEAMSRRM